MEASDRSEILYRWGGWCSNSVSGPYGVGLWKNISWGWPSLCHYILYDIGDRSRVKFWPDYWCGETPLAVNYPELFRFCRNKEARVAELMKLTNGVLFWDVSFFRGFPCSGIGCYVELHGYNIWLISKGGWGG